MKIHILYPTVDSPTGGTNQFLKMLKKNLQTQNLYAKIDFADVILFNSWVHIPEAIDAKYKYPNKIFIHRIDGLAKLYNKPEDMRDNIAQLANKWISDANIYQTNWAREKNYKFGIPPKTYELTICNAVDVDIFNRENKCTFSQNRKIRIIATSWSSNKNKGFSTYQYLDEHLDWNKYEMTFVGNSPVTFKHITYKPPMKSVDLAKELKQHDIYISASQKEACSNAVLEALSCGLPALCLKDGGQPELVKDGGLLFETQEEIPRLLEELVENYDKYQQNIEVISMNTVVDEYVSFAQRIKGKVDIGEYTPKRINWLRAKYLETQIKIWGR